MGYTYRLHKVGCRAHTFWREPQIIYIPSSVSSFIVDSKHKKRRNLRRIARSHTFQSTTGGSGFSPFTAVYAQSQSTLPVPKEKVMTHCSL